MLPGREWLVCVTISVNQFFVGNSDNFSKMMVKLKKKKLGVYVLYSYYFVML